MRSGQPSTTAQTVALARAIESARPRESRLFEDPYAERFLGGDGRWLLARLRGARLRPLFLGLMDRIAPGLLPYAVGRTAYIDEVLTEALRAGTRQVVILGAGYDTRALRTTGIERAVVYEIDHPDTQATKREHLGSELDEIMDRVRLVAVDFDRQDLSEALREAGFRFDEPAFVIWEGVMQYLPAEAIDTTLGVLASLRSGSELVFTYVDRALIEGTRRFPGGRRIMLAVKLAGEPFRSGLAPGEVADFLRPRGFELLEDLGSAELSARYFAPLGRGDRPAQTERVARARTL